MSDNLNILSKLMLTSILCSAFSIHANYAYNKEEKLYKKDLELEKIKSIWIFIKILMNMNNKIYHLIKS